MEHLIETEEAERRKEKSRFNGISYKQDLFLMKSKFGTSESVMSVSTCEENQE